MRRKTLLLVVVFLGSAVSVDAKNPEKSSRSVAVVTLAATSAEDDASKSLSQALRQNHYRKIEVNDSLSQQILSRYIENLDGAKSYFVASEVASMQKLYGNRLDDEFLAGKSHSGFGVYNFFLKRAKEKMRFMKTMADTATFDFTNPEVLDLDRKADP